MSDENDERYDWAEGRNVVPDSVNKALEAGAALPEQLDNAVDDFRKDVGKKVFDVFNGGESFDAANNTAGFEEDTETFEEAA